MDNNYAKNVQNNIDKFLKEFLFNLLTFIYFTAIQLLMKTTKLSTFFLTLREKNIWEYGVCLKGFSLSQMTMSGATKWKKSLLTHKTRAASARVVFRVVCLHSIPYGLTLSHYPRSLFLRPRQICWDMFVEKISSEDLRTLRISPII